MIHQPEFVKQLLKKHIEGTLTPQEQDLLDRAFFLYDDDELLQLLDETGACSKFEEEEEEEEEEPEEGEEHTPLFIRNSPIQQKFVQHSFPPKRKAFISRRYKKVWYAVAVVIALVLMTIQPFLQSKLKFSGCAPQDHAIQSQPPKENNKAKIILPDGTESTLDYNMPQAAIAGDSYTIKMNSEQQITYIPSRRRTHLPEINTSVQQVVTLPGDQCRLLLHDSSLIWIGPSSKVIFPTVYGNYYRQLTVDGEVLVEVGAGDKAPLYVHTEVCTVKATGTVFNVNTLYDSTYITLKSGSVEVYVDKDTIMLQPGEQLRISNLPLTEAQMCRYILGTVSMPHALAWTRGVISFQDAPLRVMLQEIARWYRLSLVEEDLVPDSRISVDICHDVSLGKILEFLNENGYDVWSEDGKIGVY